MTMVRFLPTGLLCVCALIVGACAPKTPEPSVQAQQVFDRTLTSTEKEFVSLVGAMPEDKFGFAPTAGKFDGVRTFGQQAKHAAFVLNELSAVLLGESIPPTAAHENGPDDVTGKDQITAICEGRILPTPTRQLRQSPTTICSNRPSILSIRRASAHVWIQWALCPGIRSTITDRWWNTRA